MAGPQAPTAEERALRAWKLSLPAANGEPVSSKKLSEFFKTAARLVASGADTRQDIVQCLGDNNGRGLKRVNELIEQKYKHGEKPLPATAVFSEQLLPLFNVIIHPEVATSKSLLQARGTIFNLLYGLNGKSAQLILHWCSDAIASLPSDDIEAQAAYDASLKAIMRFANDLIETNTVARLDTGLHTPIKAIAANVLKRSSGDKCSHDAHEALVQLDRVSRVLELGLTLPTATTSKRVKVDAKPVFKISRAAPGGRHDNDFEDFSKIGILPTPQEIASTAEEYLPVIDIDDNYHQGLEGVLDRSFRLLREDTVGQLRDAVHAVIANLAAGVKARGDKQKFSTRLYAYEHVAIESVSYDEEAGVALTVSFDQPVLFDVKKQRMDYWACIKRLDPEALVCLVDSHGNTMFFTVHPLSKPKAHQSLFGKKRTAADAQFRLFFLDKHRAQVSLHPITSSEHALRPLVQWARQPTQLSLVEFPGVVLPAFKPTLEALQSMKAERDLIMIESYLIPQLADKDELKDIRLPMYATRPGFNFEMKCITNDNASLILATNEAFDIKQLQDRTPLDDAKAVSLHHALTNELALIQGPPGTGKSYVGVALMRVLLANKLSKRNPNGADLGPIIVVCYTNHALDQTLEHLVKIGVEQVVRIGGRSKSECLKECNLRILAHKLARTKHEKAKLSDLITKKQGLEEDLLLAMGKLTQANTSTFEAYLRENVEHWGNYIFGEPAEEGWTKVEAKSKDEVVQKWIMAGQRPREGHEPRSMQDLMACDVATTTTEERYAIVSFLNIDYNTELEKGLMAALSAHQDLEKERYEIQDDKNLRILQDANVIGLTTTGLAKNLHLLRKLGSKVLVCEEAGEVLEAHLLTCFLPSMQHVVLIGDHQQLRPGIANYDLSSESVYGKQFSFDVSLFERLINPQPGLQRLPYSTLETQRRMHPSVSRLIRDTLYPDLEDADNVAEYPEVVGMRKRLYWLDHRHREGANDGEDISTSKWNDFEIQMVTGIVKHIISQGVYEPEDIAVLTPYVSQLSHLRQELGKTHAVVLGELDLEELEEHSSIKGGSDAGGDGLVVVQTTLLKSLRLATVDNFQGEEAKIIILSLVRSNPEKNCGFLRTENRINVALSRAQHGMYIIGDSETASARSKMWAEVAAMLSEDNNIGTSLELQCPRHKDSSITISKPEDFLLRAPEGGCDKPCGEELDCGHACPTKCHSEVMHRAVRCMQKCTKVLTACSHACEAACSDICEEKRCGILIHNAERTLPGGHVVQDLPCWQAQLPLAHVKCPVMVEHKLSACRHKVTVACHLATDAIEFACQEACGAKLACGHLCKRKCCECNKSVPSDIPGENCLYTDHGMCREICSKPLSECDHGCGKFCHEEKGDCSPCMALCAVSCPHSRCERACSEPCSYLPCNKRCKELLDCGHQCPSVCGEECPDEKFCQVCGSDDVLKADADLICKAIYRDIQLDIAPCVFFPQCDHFCTIDTLDEQVRMEDYYNFNRFGKIDGIISDSKVPPINKHTLKCNTCGSSLERLNRLKRLVLLGRMHAITAEMRVKSKIDSLESNFKAVEQVMANLRSDDQAKVYARMLQLGDDAPPQSKPSGFALSIRHKELIGFRDKLSRYRAQLEARVGASSAESMRTKDMSMANARALVVVASLRIRCALLYYTDIMTLRQAPIKTPLGAPIKTDMLPPLAPLSLHPIPTACVKLIEDARKAGDILAEAHGHIALAKLFAFQRQGNCDNNQIKAASVAFLADSKLAEARKLIKQFPQELSVLESEVRKVEVMIVWKVPYHLMWKEGFSSTVSRIAAIVDADDVATIERRVR